MQELEAGRGLTCNRERGRRAQLVGPAAVDVLDQSSRRPGGRVLANLRPTPPSCRDPLAPGS